jgi:hypothetical protein
VRQAIRWGTRAGVDRQQRFFQPEVTEVRTAREWTRTVVTSWGFAPSEASLIVTELSANAVRHARTAFAVTLSVSGRTLRIELADRSHKRPMPAEPVADAGGGRGLVIVAAVARSWGIRDVPLGKAVWAEVVATPLLRGGPESSDSS